MGNITAQLAVEHKVNSVYFNNTALEKISSDGEAFNLMRMYLKSQGFSDGEVAKITTLMHEKGDDMPFDYGVEGQRIFGHVMHLAFVLAQKQFLELYDYEVSLHESDINAGNGRHFYENFNCSNYYIIAKKKKVITNK